MKKGLLLLGAAFMALSASAQIGEYVTTSQVWDFQAEWKAHDPHTSLTKQNLSSPGYVLVAKVGQNDRNTNKYKSYADTMTQVLPKVNVEKPYVPFASDPSFVLQRSQVFVSSNSWPNLVNGGLLANASDFFIGVDSLKAGDKIVMNYSGNKLPVTFANGYSSLFKKEQVGEGEEAKEVIDTIGVFTVNDTAVVSAFPITDSTAWAVTGDTVRIADVNCVYNSGDTIVVDTVGADFKVRFLAFYVSKDAIISSVSIIRNGKESKYDFKGEYAKYEKVNLTKVNAKRNFRVNKSSGSLGNEDRQNCNRRGYDIDSVAISLPDVCNVYTGAGNYQVTEQGLIVQDFFHIDSLYEGQQLIVNFVGDSITYAPGTGALGNKNSIAEVITAVCKGVTLQSGVSKVGSGDTITIAGVDRQLLVDTLKEDSVKYSVYMSFRAKMNNNFIKSVSVLTTEFQLAEPLDVVGNEELSASIFNEEDSVSVGKHNRLANGQTYTSKIYVKGIAENGGFGLFGLGEEALLVGATPGDYYYDEDEDNSIVKYTFTPISATPEDTAAYEAEIVESLKGAVVDVVAVRDGSTVNFKFNVAPAEPYKAWEAEINSTSAEFGEYDELELFWGVDSACLYVYEEEVSGTEKVKPVEGTETYVAVVDGKLAPEFAAVVDESGNATNIDGAGNSVVEFGTENVKGKAVGSATITAVVEDANGSLVNWNPETNALRDDRKFSASETSAASWTVKNENPGSIKEGTINVVKGTGNPSLNIYAEVFEGDNGTVSRAGYEAWQITKDANGNLTIPETAPVGGLYYEFTTEEDGLLSLGIWVNKGKRQTIVYDKTDSCVVSYNKEGYINGKNDEPVETGELNEDGTPKTVAYATYLDNEAIKAIHEEAFAGQEDDQFVIGAGNQAFKGNLIINAEKAHTYLVLVVNTQIGFSGYTFKVGQENWIDIDSLSIEEPKDTTSVEPGDTTVVEPVAGLEGDIIKWNATVAAADLANVTAGETTLAIVNDGKMLVDANTAWFGTSEADSIMLSYRLKTGGKTSASRSLTLTVPADGALYIYARSGGKEEPRNVVLSQDGVEIGRKAFADNDTTYAGSQMLYIPMAVNVKAGTISVEAVDNSINFYGFRFVAGGTVDYNPGGDEPGEAIVYVKADSKVDGEVYNLAGQVVRGALKPGLYIKNGKLFMVK